MPPFFSIVVPTYNRPALLRDCLEALAGLDYPAARYEVVVVDDGGEQLPHAVVAGFRDRLDVRLLRQRNAGPGAARNAGAAVAHGEYLAFTDDDCRPAPDWLRAFADAYAGRPGCLLGGQTLNGVAGNVYSEASQALQAWLYDYCESRPSPLRFFASNNLSLPAVRFREMGGFDTATTRYASEDRELCGRWQAGGGELAYAPAARVFHYHALGAGSFIGQHFAYGRGAYRLRLARERQGLPPLPGDPRWMLASVARYPFAEGVSGRGAKRAGLAFCTHLANVAGYLYERASLRDQHVPSTAKNMKAYIITLFDNRSSFAAARACYDSARLHGYDVEYFKAANGKTGSAFLKQEGIRHVADTGKADPALIEHQRRWMRRAGTVGCYASHYRLWELAVELQEPIVIFEHDALALAPFPDGLEWQDVLHLECEGNLVRRAADWAQGDRMETGEGVYRLGFTPVELPGLVCIPCCHAYAIKPHTAQALIADAKANGWFAADRFVREPVVMIETHNPSLATFQPEYMHVSSTSPRPWGGNGLPRTWKGGGSDAARLWRKIHRTAYRSLLAGVDLALRAGRLAMPKPARHFLWTRGVGRIHAWLTKTP